MSSGTDENISTIQDDSVTSFPNIPTIPSFMMSTSNSISSTSNPLKATSLSTNFSPSPLSTSSILSITSKNIFLNSILGGQHRKLDHSRTSPSNDYLDSGNSNIDNDNRRQSRLKNFQKICTIFAPFEMLDQWQRIVFGSMIFLTAFITFLLNVMVIVTLVKNKAYQHRQKRLVLGSQVKKISLATNKLMNSDSMLTELDVSESNRMMADVSFISVILYSSICVPAMYLETINQIPKHYNGIIIRALRFCFYVSPIASSFMHLLMAFDRFLAIKRCFQSESYWYRRHYTSCILLIWLSSIMIVTPFFRYNQYGRTMQIVLTLLRLMFTFSIPSILTLALYVSIAYELHRVRKETRTVNEFLANNSFICQNPNIICKIMVLAGIHFLCWFPFSVAESLSDLFPRSFHYCDSETYHRLMALLILITSMSGIAYPILYCFVSNEFRKTIRSRLSMSLLFLFVCYRIKSSSNFKCKMENQSAKVFAVSAV
ncbi:hypothetical protein SSS_06142 [Sarcoptes scabiei]|uniref:G-protein coupled receptors family 1 profile domain-containing protein n=1 Tax=Sarcoptes scabiei TaxID=52283 RepID=A0A834VDE6_SARSC|nr:hypothetical protein SSS_06142 [Sarcoptes scabiei]